MERVIEILAVVGLPGLAVLIAGWVRSKAREESRDLEERVAAVEKAVVDVRYETASEFVKSPDFKELRAEMRATNERILRMLISIQRTVDRRLGGGNVEEERED